MEKILWKLMATSNILYQHSSNIFFDVQNQIGYRTGQVMVLGTM